ncbi:MAG: HAMP domain-containing sensor histidine kinase [Elusimicrobiota bacterium]
MSGLSQAGPSPRQAGSSERRGVYFAFQGLLMAVLLLLFLYHHQAVEGWVARFWFLLVVLTGSLVLLQTAPKRTLERWWFQMGLFAGDTALASLTLHWAQRNLDFFLLYTLIIFGTALTRSLLQGLVIAAVTSLLYILSSWNLISALPPDTEFWLPLLFLWITTFLLAILSQDTKQAQQQQQRHYQQRLIHVESLATLGQVAGEVAHRIKGPLTTIRVNAEVLGHRHCISPEARRELDEIQEQVEHCKTILKDLLDLGRIEEIVFARFDLRTPLLSAIKSIEPQLRHPGIRKRVAALPEAMMVEGDQSLLHEAILAVLQNAVEAAGQAGTVEVSARTAAERSAWWSPGGLRRVHTVTIRDDGVGIAREDLARIFQPFFTSGGKAGSGLGLSASYRILQKHGGTIEADSEGPGRGTTITLTIPAAPRGD